MNVKKLGIAGIIGAPFLCIDTISGGFNPYQYSSLQGFFGILYIAGWMCSVIGLRQIRATGNGKGAQIAFIVQMTLLSSALAWSFYEMIDPHSTSLLYRLLDFSWPASNAFMLVTGIMVLRASTLTGWKRFAPLVVGLWLYTGTAVLILYTRTPVVLLAINLYSAFAWGLMGFSLFLHGREQQITNRYAASAVAA